MTAPRLASRPPTFRPLRWDRLGIGLLALAVLAGCGGGASPAPATGADTETPVSASGTLKLPDIDVPAAAPNVLSITLDRGPDGTAYNSPYVSITVCVPGGDKCQTLDHVLVDTGSNGLRVRASALRADIALPVVTASGQAVAECMHFASGYAWGSVHRADVRMAGEQALALPIQVIEDRGQTGVPAPAACTKSGPNLGGILAAKAILGIGMKSHDCGPACVTSKSPSIYFACGTLSCVSTTLPLESQVANPVPLFAQNNNGVMLVLPQVPISGTPVIQGALVFGIGTEANNQIGAATVFDVDKSGLVRTTYKGSTYASFLDSGSNGLFFPDADLPTCGLFYCPLLPTGLNATISSPKGVSGTIDFIVDSPYWLRADSVAAHLGGKGGPDPISSLYDWGLPFFFGRAVHVAIQDAVTPAGRGPFWAF
jgi:hypothetical protein